MGIKVEQLSPLRGRVIAEKIKMETERKDIDFALPDDATEDFKEAKVVAIGKPELNNENNEIPTQLSVGDHIIFQWGDRIKIDGKEYYSLKEANVLAVVNSK